MIITNNCQPPNLSEWTELDHGAYGKTFVKGNRVLKQYYVSDFHPEDDLSSDEVLAGCLRQNKCTGFAPKVFSVGKRADGMIYVEMEFLAGYRPIYRKEFPKQALISLKEKLASLNIAHGDLSSGNVMTNGEDVMIIDFDLSSDATNGSKEDAQLISRLANFYGKDESKKVEYVTL